jgi:murein DD-endopeptidase MepM/ murein hydrolase activator NlpD
MKQLILLFVCCFSFEFVMAQQNMPCVSKQEMDSVLAKIKANRPGLVKQGKLKEINPNIVTAYNHSFIWPIIAAPNYHRPGFYYISNYVDLDFHFGDDDTTTVLDYNCGHRTYDNPAPHGYNHSGIDIAIGPFGWKMMDDENVYVVAAEGGVIVDKHSGEFSRTCKKGVSSTGLGNYIIIEHSDGVKTVYMHMKDGTLTNKDTGDVVSTGEYLGVVGSSGNSTGPHLHFEVHSPFDEILDPFQNGPCHDDYFGYITGSLWANEEPYINKKILSVFTMSGPYTPRSCDTTGFSYGTSEIVPYRNHFSPSSFVYFSAAVRDITTPTTVRLRVYNPNGTLIYDYTYDITFYDDMRILPTQLLQLGADIGTYRLLCTYNGVSYPHFFTVGCPPSQTLSGTRATNTGVITGGSINSTETIPATSQNVEYQAETFIQFNPGFTATAGCGFTGRIDACTVGGQLQVSPDKKTKRE